MQKIIGALLIVLLLCLPLVAAPMRYEVKKGDTLKTISQKTGIPVAQIKRLNKIGSNKVVAGSVLVLRKSKGHKSAVASSDDTANDTESAIDLQDDEKVNRSFVGKWENEKESLLLVKVAKSFIGTPYKLGGSTPRGIDCSAFVAKVYDIFDVNMPRTVREQARLGITVARDDLRIGDLMFFNTRRAYGHVGIYIGDGKFIHAPSRIHKGTVRIDSTDGKYFAQRFVKATRLKSPYSSANASRPVASFEEKSQRQQ